MPRSICLGIPAFVFTLCCLLYSTNAEAKDMSKRFGIGGQRSLTGYSGVHGKYFIEEHWSVDLSIGLRLFKPTNDADRDLIGGTAITPGFNYWIIPGQQSGPIQASLGVGGRIGLYIMMQDGTNEQIEVDFELPVVAEVFLGNHFSLAPEVGLVFRIPIGEQGGFQYPRTGFGMIIGDNTGLFGAGSFNFYF